MKRTKYDKDESYRDDSCAGDDDEGFEDALEYEHEDYDDFEDAVEYEFAYDDDEVISDDGPRIQRRESSKPRESEPRIQQGLEPHYARQYRCVHTFPASTVEGVQKAACAAAMPDHVELLIVCAGCTKYNQNDGPFRAHCVNCYKCVRDRIPAGKSHAARHWSLEKNCPQDGDAGDVFKALNYVDWKTLSKWKAEGDLPDTIPLDSHLERELSDADVAVVRASVCKALSVYPKTRFLEVFPSERARKFNDTGKSPNRQQLFGIWQLGACPSCCQYVFPPPRPIDLQPNAMSIPTPNPQTRRIVLEDVRLETLKGRSGKVLVLETVVDRVLRDPEAVKKLTGRFQEDLGNMRVEILQEDPNYRRMVKSSPDDKSPNKYDAVFTLIRTKEETDEDSQLVSMKMLQVVFNFLHGKFGSGRQGHLKAQSFMYKFFTIWRLCGWYLAKAKEEAARADEATSRTTEQLPTRGSKRKRPPAPTRPQQSKGKKDLVAAALGSGLREVSQRNDRSNGANGHAGHLTLHDVRLAASSEYLAKGVPRNNPCSLIVIPEIDEEVGCRKARVFYMGAPRDPGATSKEGCANRNTGIPRFGFQVTPNNSTFMGKLKKAIAYIAADAAEEEALHEFFELYSASMEDAATVLRLYNKETGTNMCTNALDLEQKSLQGMPDKSALERLACRNIVSASGAANGGHRDNYGGRANMTNERLEMKLTFPAPRDGKYKLPTEGGAFIYDWIDYNVKLSDWTNRRRAKHGRAPPGCLVYPELGVGTICFCNADIEFHVLHQLFHCSARVGVPENYLHLKPEDLDEELRRALLECNRGVWGLDDDLIPRFYRCGGSVTTYRKLI